MSGPIVRGLTSIVTPGTATKVTVDQFGRVTALGTADLSSADVTGILAAGRFPALTGDVTTVAGALGTTLATVNPNVGSFALAAITVNAKGLVTAAASASVTGSGNVVLATSPTIVTPTIAKLANLNTNGFVKTSAGDGTLSVDTSTYITGNQTITLSGDASGSGATSIAVTLATVNANVGSFSLATVTVNDKGLITSASAAATTGSGSVVLATSPSITSPTVSTLTLTGGGYIRPSADSTGAILFTKADGATEIGRIDTTNGRLYTTGALGVRTQNPQAALDVVGTDLLNTSYALKLKTTSAELITNAADRDFSGAGNWTGANWAIVSAAFKHTTGATTAATLAAANLTSGQLVASNIYKVVFTISGATAGSVTSKLGSTGTGGVAVSGNITYTQYLLLAGAPFDLTFTPTTDFDGSIDNISVTRMADIFLVDNSGGVGIFAPASSNWLLIGRQPSTAYFTFSNEGIGFATISTASTNSGLLSFASSTSIKNTGTPGNPTAVINVQTTVSPASGTGDNHILILRPTINQGGGTGDVSMIRIDPTYTSVLGTLRLLDFTIGANGARVTEITRAGLVSLTPIDAVTNASTTTLTLGHYLTTVNAGANNIAARLEFKLADSTSAIGAGVVAGAINVKLVSATHASYTSQMDLTVTDASATRTVIAIGANNTAGLLGFFGAAAVVQQVYGATLTNNVTVGGTNNTIADFTSLTIYATDAAAIRNNIYQLARTQKLVLDALRTYGLLS